MSNEQELPGWAWFETGERPGEQVADEALSIAFARCFAGRDGEQALRHLERVFLERRLGPGASDAELRHLEGQRSAVAQIKALIARGRG